MADSQELAELSISLKATDVNVEKTLSEIKTSFKNLQKDMNDVFNLTSVKSAIKDIQAMSNEIKSTVSKINGIANNIQSVANETSKLAKETGMKKFAKDVKEVSQETKKIKFDGVKQQVSLLSNSFGELSNKAIKYANTTSSLYKQVYQFNALSKTIAMLEKEYNNNNSTIQRLKLTYNELAKTMNSAKGIKVSFGTEELKYGQVELSKFRIAISATIKALEIFGNKSVSSLSKLSPIISSVSNSFRNFKPFVNIQSSISQLGGLSGIGNQISSSFNKAKSSFNQFSNGIKNGIKNLNLFDKNQKKVIKNNYPFSRMIKDFTRNLIMYGFAMRGIMSIVNSFGTTLFGALKTNDQFVSSLNNIKANLAVAFMPIYTYILPAINALMSAIASVTRVIASLIASIFGTSYEEQLKKANDLFGAIAKNEEAEKGGADSAKKKTKEYEKQLHAMDEINNLTLPKDSSGGGASGGASVDFEPMEGFGTDITKLKEKLKELFSPITESWNKYGKGVIDSFKFSLESIKGLISSIGQSWKEVWLNGTGEQTFDYIFQILTNILMTIGNISVGLREAWEINKTGTKIIQSLWNSFNNVLGIVYDLTNALMKWSYQVDFSPLLNSVLNLSLAFEKLTSSIRDKLAPIFDKYLTPTLNYLVEKIIPSVINGISYLVDFFSEHLGALAIVVSTIFGAKMIAPITKFFKAFTGSATFSVLTSLFGTLSGLVGALTSGFGALLISLSGLTTKIPFVGGIMNDLGVAMMSLNGTVLLLGGSFFYLLGSNDELQKFVNNLIKSFSELVKKINFKKIANDFSKGIGNILQTIADGINGFDWASVGTILSKSISGIFNFVANIDFGSIVRGLSSIVNGIIKSLTTLIKNINWSEVGASLVSGIVNLLSLVGDFIINFDWLSLIVNVFNLIGSAIGGMEDLLLGAISGLFTSVLTNVATWIYDLGSNIGNNIIRGVVEGISKIIMIPVNLFNDFVNWIKELLGIHSPSTVFEDIGTNIILGLFNGIKSIIDTVLKLFETLIDSIIKAFEMFGNFVKSYVVPVVESIGNIFKWLWNNVMLPLINWIGSTFTSIWQNLLNFFNSNVKPIVQSVGNSFKSIWDNILKPFINWVGGTFKSLWQGTMNTINSITNTVKSIVTNVWNSVKTSFNSIISFVKGSFTSAWSSAWNSVKNIFSKVWNSFYSIAKAPINGIIGAINKMIDGIESGVNSVIRALNRFSIKIPSWVPGFGGKSFGFNLSTINLGHVPRLASGGIAYGDTLVQVAEYQNARSNPEVIAPLDKLNGIMYENLKQILSKNQNQYNPNDYEIVTHIELKTENETLAKSVAKGKAKIEKKTGKPLFSY